MGKVLRALRSSPLLAPLADDELLTVAEASQEMICEPERSIFAQGGWDERVYILQEGKVAMHVRLRPGSRCGGEAAAVIDHPGQAFDWSALVDEDRLSVRARCAERTRLIAIDLKRLTHPVRLLILKRLVFYLFAFLQELRLCPFNLADLVELYGSSRL